MKLASHVLTSIGLIVVLTSCSSFRYRAAAKGISSEVWQGPSLYCWMQASAEECRTEEARPVIDQCVALLSQSDAPLRVRSLRKNITSCMNERGWYLKWSGIVVLT
jgi:hypothetical protein